MTPTRRAALSMAAAVVLGAMLGACRKQPAEVLGQEEMAALLADMNIADGVASINYNRFGTDSAKQLLQQSVLAAHGVSRATMDTSLMWYGAHLDQYMEVCDRVIEILQDKQDGLVAAANTRVAIAGDSVELWPNPSHIIGSPRTLARLYTFDIEPDSNWHPGDIYTLRYKVINALTRVGGRVLADYADGTTSYRDETGTSQGWATLRLQLDSTRTPRRVYGYIAVEPEPRDYFHIDSISLTRTRRPAGGRSVFYPHRRFDFGTGPDATDSTDTAAATETVGGNPAATAPATTPKPGAARPDSTRAIPSKSARRI